MIVIGVRSYRCACRSVIPESPICGERGVEDDE
jgi:hypothetical protein